MRLREIIIDIGFLFDSTKMVMFGRYMDRATSRMDIARKAAVGLTGALTALTGVFGAAIVNTAQYSEEIFNNATAFEANFEKFQGYRFAIQRLGGSTDDFIDLLGTLVDRAKDAAEGSKTYAKEFKRVGISVAELRKKKPIELLEMFIDRTAKVKDRTDAIAASVRLFGDDLGRRVLPAIVGGATSFAKLAKNAKEAGFILKRDQIENLRALRGTITLATITAQGFGRYLVAQLSPALKRFGDRMNGAVLAVGAFIRSRIDKFAENMSIRFEKLWLALKRMYQVAQRLGGLTGMFKAFAAALGLLATAYLGRQLYALIQGLWLLRKASMAALLPSLALFAKFLFLGALFVGVIAVLEDLWIAMEGGNSVIGDLAKKNELFRGILEGFKMAVNAVKQALSDMGPIMEALGFGAVNSSDIFKMLALSFLFVAGVIGVTLIAAVYLIIRAFQGLIILGTLLGEALAAVFLGVSEVVAGVMGFISDAIDVAMAGINKVMKAYRRVGDLLGTGENSFSFKMDRMMETREQKDVRVRREELTSFGNSSLGARGDDALRSIGMDPRENMVQTYARQQQNAAPMQIREGDMNITVAGTGDPYQDTRRAAAAGRRERQNAQARFATGAR